MVAVVTHLCRQVERARQTCLTCVQQKLKSLVSVGSRAETCILTHCPQTIAMHGLVNAACERRLARHAKSRSCVEATQSLGGIQRLDRDP